MQSRRDQRDKALAWLQKAKQEHSPALSTLKVEPGLDPLRNDPRFQDVLRRVGLGGNSTPAEIGSKP